MRAFLCGLGQIYKIGVDRKFYSPPFIFVRLYSVTNHNQSQPTNKRLKNRVPFTLNLKKMGKCNKENLQVAGGIAGFVFFLVAGILLVYHNNYVKCDSCKPGFNATVINDVKSCVTQSNGVISSYSPCYTYYQEPGFGIGAFMVSVCLIFIWVAAGTPTIVIIDL